MSYTTRKTILTWWACIFPFGYKGEIDINLLELAIC